MNSFILLYACQGYFFPEMPFPAYLAILFNDG